MKAQRGCQCRVCGAKWKGGKGEWACPNPLCYRYEREQSPEEYPYGTAWNSPKYPAPRFYIAPVLALKDRF